MQIKGPNNHIKNDSRVKLAFDWINELNISNTIDLTSLQPASEDASFRRYFRINYTNSHKSLILMDCPPTEESTEKFVKISKLFNSAAVRVPKIFEKNHNLGFLLIEDFGYQTLLQKYTENIEMIVELQKNALATIINLQMWGDKNPEKLRNLPIFTEKALCDEVDLFFNWYLKEYLKIKLPNSSKTELSNLTNCICRNIANQPKVIVHKDFHSRNLMFLENYREIGVLDFQDAILGPVSYDLISLIRDAYYSLDYNCEVKIARWFWSQAKKMNLKVPKDFGKFCIDCDHTSLQRHLKVLGIFCRLAYRDNKKKYLVDLYRVKTKCIQILSRHREYEYLMNFLKNEC